MIDPLPPPPRLLVSLTTPIAQALGIHTFPLHAHEMLAAFCFYYLLKVFLSPAISTLLFPTIYSRFQVRTKINWDLHVVSLIQSSLISALALWVIRTDEERAHLSWEGRIWGYTGAGGMVQAFAAGYFLFDVWISLVHIDILGWGSLLHAASALVVTTLGFRPFANYYGLSFVLYELSTPFLNMHWFFDKLRMTGSRAQLYNGIVLTLVFCLCRLIWGVYQSVCIYRDIWEAVRWQYSIASPDSIEDISSPDIRSDSLFNLDQLSRQQALPVWLVCSYLFSNTMLNILNFFWFGKMIKAVTSRFAIAKHRSD